MHPNSLANLERGAFKPGQSGNPNGWPKGVPRVSTALAKLLRTPAGDDYLIVNKADEIAQALYSRAQAGDVNAICVILDRTEGRTPQTLNIGAAELPTTELVSRLVEAFGELGIDEPTTQRVLLRLSAGDGDD